jgi:hypothetical protein
MFEAILERYSILLRLKEQYSIKSSTLDGKLNTLLKYIGNNGEGIITCNDDLVIHECLSVEDYLTIRDENDTFINKNLLQYKTPVLVALTRLSYDSTVANAADIKEITKTLYPYLSMVTQSLTPSFENKLNVVSTLLANVADVELTKHVLENISEIIRIEKNRF